MNRMTGFKLVLGSMALAGLLYAIITLPGLVQDQASTASATRQTVAVRP